MHPLKNIFSRAVLHASAFLASHTFTKDRTAAFKDNQMNLKPIKLFHVAKSPHSWMDNYTAYQKFL